MALLSSSLSILILISTSFLLGAFFTHWAVDHSTSWTPSPLASSITSSLQWYSTVAAAPGWYSTVLLAAIASGMSACVIKIAVREGEGGGGSGLFDAASFLLLCSVLTVYTSSISFALDSLASLLPPSSPILTIISMTTHRIPDGAVQLLGSLAASHLLIAISLTGVLSLQGGQAYSEKDY